MRLARIRQHKEVRTAVISLDGATATVLPANVEVQQLLTLDPAQRNAIAAAAAEHVCAADVQLLAPLQPPTVRDFSVFEQHIEGARRARIRDAEVPEVWYQSPFCYFSNPYAVNGPGDDVAVPPGCAELDFELEVAAVIGTPGSDLAPGEARAHIAGYTILNDWSARDLQRAEMALGLGICKGKDFATTLGPWIVTADEFAVYQQGDRLDVKMVASVNGRVIGEDTLANMAWSFEELVSYASRGTIVNTGDVLGSGTCGSGCLLEMWGRFSRDAYPPLEAGDTVTLEVEGIGVLTNQVVPGRSVIPLPPARRRAPAADAS